MSRDEVEGFLTDEGRAEVKQFITEALAEEAVATDPTETSAGEAAGREAMSPADEARAWIQRLAKNADQASAENEANPIPEELCPPTHFSALVRLKPLPDGRVSMYEPGVEVTPDRLWALLEDYGQARADRDAATERAVKAEAEAVRLRATIVDEHSRLSQHLDNVEEVARLVAELVDAREANALLRKGSRKLRTDYLDVTTELAELRERIGSADQWCVRYETKHGHDRTEPTQHEPSARGWLDAWRTNYPGQPATLMYRWKTDWREVPDA